MSESAREGRAGMWFAFALGSAVFAACVIATGSLVTKDVPAGHLAMGMPCRPVRRITGADRILSDGLR